MTRDKVFIESLTKVVDIGYEPQYVITDNEGFSSRHMIDEYEMIRLNEDLQKFLIDRHFKIREAAPDYRHLGPSNEELDRYPALETAWREFLVIQRMCVR